jgi:hypothetical protein
MQRKYEILSQKLTKLKNTQKPTPKNNTTFYPRIINNTNIVISENELNLLNKGLKYNTWLKPKTG